jgi:hypothetical protein
MERPVRIGKVCTPESVPDQDLAPQVTRQLRDCQPGGLDVGGGGVRVGVPVVHARQRPAVPGGAVIGPGDQRS